METLTPIQRVAVIAICLALTILIAMLLLPWVWAQIVERFPILATPILGAPYSPELEATAALTQVSALPIASLFA